MRTLAYKITILMFLSALVVHAAGLVTLVTDSKLEPPVEHSLGKLSRALLQQGYAVSPTSSSEGWSGDLLVVLGVAGSSGPAATELQRLSVPLPQGPEALVIRTTELAGKPAVVLCGSDSRGLMYAALDTADRISWSDDPARPFAHVRDTSEKPFLAERAISIYTMQRAWFEERLYDERHWERYFDMLARSRINSFAVVFGYENGGFMAPLYPYFFDLDEFPDVKLVGITAEQQQRNTAAFKRMIQIAHDRGIDFVPAPWDHIYRGGVQGGGIAGADDSVGRQVHGLVTGVNSENVAAYNKAAISKFLAVFPEIDGIQFRMHGESGLKPDEMAGFWHEVFTEIKQVRPDLRLDLRAKELPDVIINDAVDMGLKARIATKYWMEQQGLPFHPTHINRQNQHDRRHGLADLLRYPQRYKVHWRLWNGGTNRLLLWADPEYVRRFAETCRLYNGDSFEVNEMLATKMLGSPHEQTPLPILTPGYRFYDYEFERYWHHFQVWGRLSYNPEAEPEIWEREFERRFGAGGADLMQGLHQASRVLPRIVASSYLYRLFPTTRGWAEMMRGGDLPEYAGEQGSDIQQFMNVRDEARSRIYGSDTAMRRPGENSRWFAQLSERILSHVAQAEKAAGDKRGREFNSTVTDLKILAYLAQYHAERLQAGVHYNLYEATGDAFALEDAIGHETKAVEAWEQIVASAGDVYNEELAFGVHRVGFPRHWKEELENLMAGLDQLRGQRGLLRRPWSGGASPTVSHAPVRRIGPNDALAIRATVASDSGITSVRALVAKGDGDFQAVAMKASEEGKYSVEIPSLSSEGEIRYLIEAVNSAGALGTYPSAGKSAPISVTATADTEPPVAAIDRPAKATPGQGLKVSANVTDPSGVKSVRLRYRHLTQLEDYRAIEMKIDPATGRFQAEIPGSFIVPEWDIVYFIEALDTKGNGRMYPDLDHEMPYVVVELERASN